MNSTAARIQQRIMPSRLILRLGLLGAGALSLRISHSLMLADAPLIRQPQFLIWLVITGALGLALWTLAGLRRVPRGTVWLVLAVCILDVLLRFHVVQATALSPYFVQTHAAAKIDFAARLLAEGENPYTWDYTGIYGLYSLDAPALLSLPDRYPYPALSFVLAVPAQFLRLPPLSTLSVLLYAGFLAGLFLAAPRRLQPVVLLPFFAADALLFSQMVVVGSTDALWAAALAACALLWRWRLWRALALGAALAAHPLAWLALPPLLVRTHREDSAPAAIRLGLLALAIFGAVNAPFILWDTGAWVDSLAALARINLAAFLRPLPGLPVFQPAYTVFALAMIYAVLLWLYGRCFDSLRHLCWLAPALIVTLSPYARLEIWLFCALPAAAAWMATPSSAARAAQAAPARWGTSLATAAGVVAAVLLVGLVAFRAHATLTLEPVYPLYTDASGRIETITVTVRNDGPRAASPRFFAQPRFEREAVRWRVVEGPALLPPGASADYTIQPIMESGGFFVGARIFVVDSGGAWSQPLALGDYEDYSFPDNVFNSRFHLWTRGASAPNGWRFDAAPAQRASASMTFHDGRSAIALRIEPSDGPTLAALTTTIPFPYQPFQVWVWRDPLARPATLGVQFNDGQHRIVFDFAAAEADSRLTATTYREGRIIPAGEWSLQEIDLRGVYDAAGWDLPAFRATVYRELHLDWRLVEMQLLLAARADRVVQSYFGEIIQPLERISPHILMRESLDNPVETYRRIAAMHQRMRNDHLALAALESALAYMPDDPGLLAEIAALRTRLGQINTRGGS